VRSCKRFLLDHLHQEQVVTGGNLVYLDPTDSIRLGMGDLHEPGVIRFLQQRLQPGDRVIDAGAHIGYVTLEMARAVGGGGKVFAFEPDPSNFALLQRNVAANRYANVVTVQAAVWRSDGRQRLFLRDDHHGDHRMYDPGDGRSSVEVDTISLDSYFAGDSRPLRLIKLDIQGSELHALRGMTGLLRRNPDVIVILELWPRGLRGCGAEPHLVLDLMQELGLKPWQLNPRSGRLQPVDARRLLNRLDPSSALGQLRAVLRSGEDAELVCTRRRLDAL
jgi:FkbM family methyltransferase